MSVIHKALQSANSQPQAGEHDKYNPLTKTANKTPSLPLIGLSALLLALAGLVIFWPANDGEMVSQTPVAAEKPIKTESTITAQDEIPALQVTQQTEAQPVQEPVDKVNNAFPVVEPKQVKPARSRVNQNTITTVETATIEPKPKTEKPISPLATPAPVPVIEKVSQPKTTKTQTVVSIAKKTEVTEPSNTPTAEVNPGIRNSINTWQQQTEQHLARGEIEQAEALLKNWIAALPNDSQPRIWLARIYINNEVYRAAEPLITNVSSAEAKALLGVIYERTSRPESAIKIFEDLYRAQPSNYRWLLFWAINSENAGQLAKANALYQTYLQQFSSDDAQLTAFAQQRLRNIQGQ